MSIEQEQQWITGEEIGRENRRLIEAGVPDDAPEFQALLDRIAARDDYLYERYGQRLLRLTAYAVRTSPDIVDDACSFAWVQLLATQPRRETVFPWLRTVARQSHCAR